MADESERMHVAGLFLVCPLLVCPSCDTENGVQYLRSVGCVDSSYSCGWDSQTTGQGDCGPLTVHCLLRSGDICKY